MATKVARKTKAVKRSVRHAAAAKSEWTGEDGVRLQKIRLELNFGSQKRFADALGVNRSLVSAWERGQTQGRKPHSRFLLKIASWPGVSREEVEWLIEKADVEPDVLRRAAEFRLNDEREALAPDSVIPVGPMLTFRAPASFRISRTLEGPGPSVPFSGNEVLNPHSLKYVRVRDDFMRPFFKEGDLLILDESESDPWEMEEGTCLAVFRSPEYAAQYRAERRERIEREHTVEEVAERKRTLSDPYERLGLFVGWLRKRIDQTIVQSAMPTETHPGLLTPGQPRLEMVGWFSLEAPWLPVHETLSVRQPYHPKDSEIVNASGLVVLGRLMAWMTSPNKGRR